MYEDDGFSFRPFTIDLAEAELEDFFQLIITLYACDYDTDWSSSVHNVAQITRSLNSFNSPSAEDGLYCPLPIRHLDLDVDSRPSKL